MELECIMKSGHFRLSIKPKRIIITSKIECEILPEHNSEFLLHYEPSMESFLQKRQLQTVSESHDEISLPVISPPVERQVSSVVVTWNNEQIDDFVRKLGFLEAQNADAEQKVKLFQQLNQVSRYVHTVL